ncbi:hypothetical protein ACQP3D_29735, partial [Escherichia coli]
MKRSKLSKKYIYLRGKGTPKSGMELNPLSKEINRLWKLPLYLRIATGARHVTGVSLNGGLVER